MLLYPKWFFYEKMMMKEPTCLRTVAISSQDFIITTTQIKICPSSLGNCPKMKDAMKDTTNLAIK